MIVEWLIKANSMFTNCICVVGVIVYACVVKLVVVVVGMLWAAVHAVKNFGTIFVCEFQIVPRAAIFCLMCMRVFIIVVNSTMTVIGAERIKSMSKWGVVIGVLLVL